MARPSAHPRVAVNRARPLFDALNAIAALPTGTVWAVGRSDKGDLILHSTNG
jgi:hypothetical protein